MGLELSAGDTWNVSIGTGSGGTAAGDETQKRHHLHWDEEKHDALPIYDKTIGVLNLPSSAANTGYRLGFDKFKPQAGRVWNLLSYQVFTDNEFNPVPVFTGTGLYAGIDNLPAAFPVALGGPPTALADVIDVTTGITAQGPLTAGSVFPALSKWVNDRQSLYGVLQFTTLAAAHSYYMIVEYADYPADAMTAGQIGGKVGRHPSHHHPSLNQK